MAPSHLFSELPSNEIVWYGAIGGSKFLSEFINTGHIVRVGWLWLTMGTLGDFYCLCLVVSLTAYIGRKFFWIKLIQWLE